MGARKRLICVCGLPGTGKSTVAATVAERTGGAVIRTDVVRKDLYPDPEYTSTETRTTYDEVFARAREAIDRDGVAILDGTFRRTSLREEARAVAQQAGAAFDLVRVECCEDVVKERITERTDDPSDADYSVYQLLETEFEPIRVPHFSVDNSGSKAEMRQQVSDFFAPLAATTTKSPTPSNDNGARRP